MTERLRIFAIIGIMGAVTLILGSIVFDVLYQAAFKGQESRLMELAQSQARILEAIAQNEALSYDGDKEGWEEAVLKQLREAHSKYKGMGRTGEFTLARLEGDQIVFMLRHRNQELARTESVSINSNLAEPMRQALLKKTGSIIGPDYDGTIVLAAYEPVTLLNWGLVAKIDIAEIREPFIKAAATSLCMGILLIILGAWLITKVTRPIIRRLEEHLELLEEAGNSLRKSEEQFKNIIQNYADAILVTLKDVICFANPAAETLFDRPVQELMGSDIGFPVIGKESVDIQIHQPSGALVTAILRAVEVEWDRQPAYLISLHDITERKKAEERILHLNKIILAIRNVNQLITQEQDRDRLIRGICENLVSTRGFNSAWIELMDDSGACTHCFEAGIGEPFSAFKERLKQGDIPRCVQKALAHSGVSIIEDVLNECVGCPLHSSCQDLSAFSIRLEYGEKIYGILASSLPGVFARNEEEVDLFQEVGEDIAFALNHFALKEEQRQAAADREKLEQQLFQSQKMEAIGTLAGGIAHDFNNLLTIIIGNADLLIGEIGKDSPHYEFLEDLKVAGERAAVLTRQLLTFCRKQILQPEVMNLNDVMNNIGRMLRRVIQEDIEMETILCPDLGRVDVDAGQIEQILLNLVVNARDAMPAGGRLTLETSNEELDETYARKHIGVITGPYVMLAVSDTGIGMAKEEQARIFEPFFTTKKKGKGTGLGLSTVYGIVKQSHGSIWVYSEPGKGSTFKIYLPRVEEKVRILEKTAISGETLQGSETILLVEDDEMVRKVTLKILRNCGYTVLCASDGPEAFYISRQHQEPVQLMLTDVVMPGMSGRELAKGMEEQRPEMRVLFMSGYTDNAIVHHEVLNHGVAFIQKPFTPVSLARKVRETLDR